MHQYPFFWHTKNIMSRLLLPLSWLFQSTAALRRACYKSGILPTTRFSVPVIIVGNLSVGGNGKTPCVIALARELKAAGWRPGIVSRGYGGCAKQYPQWVDDASDPKIVGDEAVLLVRATACPMVVAPDRVAAVKTLLADSNCNIVLSDDGLQHYALARTVEIVVVDGQRRFGNGYCLPAGPLRETCERLKNVDFVMSTGVAQRGEFSLQLKPQCLRNLFNPEQRIALEDFSADNIHAVAGIGNPERFFASLSKSGLQFECHAFPDHHQFSAEDLHFSPGATVIMTEKDAVKCRSFAQPSYWYLPIEAELESNFKEVFFSYLNDTLI